MKTLTSLIAAAALALAASALALAQPQTPLGPTPQGLGGPRPVPLNMRPAAPGPSTSSRDPVTLDRVIADKIMICGYHFPFPGAGTVAKDGAGYALSVMKA